MSAALCGKRSSFDDPYHPHPSKRSRSSCALSHLRSLFPHMNQQVLETALQDAANDLDSAIKSLTHLSLKDKDAHLPTQETITSNPLPSVNPSAAASASEWVELFVQEMMNASDLDDARSRASRALQVFEKSISSNSRVTESMQKEQMEVLLRENAILKRAVAIQHDRHKEQEGRLEEAQHLRQMVSQYQEQVRTLELNNYALIMHLKQAQQPNSIPPRFNPDVF